MPSVLTPGAPFAPTDLYGIVQDAVNAGDVAAFVDVYDDDASVVFPPDGTVARGHDEIRDAIADLLELRPHLAIVAGPALHGERFALVHGRWHLSVVDGGCRIELSGLGTMVSRRSADGRWRIVLDDPLTGP